MSHRRLLRRLVDFRIRDPYDKSKGPFVRILKAEFIRSCVGPAQFPTDPTPEIAFVGRSNVGKSSLINSLLQRKGLAKVSRTPGKTRAINLFTVATDDPQLSRFVLADLPGYGYAKVSKTERAQWAPLVEEYLARDEQVCAVVMLVESRVLGSQDAGTLLWLRSIGYEPVVVATKADKLKAGERVAALRRLQEGLGLAGSPTFMAYSSVTGEGRERLWSALKERCRT
jgi:GTP-binding protein